MATEACDEQEVNPSIIQYIAAEPIEPRYSSVFVLNRYIAIHQSFACFETSNPALDADAKTVIQLGVRVLWQPQILH